MYLLIISFIIYCCYLEFSPKLGNILLRYDSNNIKRFCIGNVFNMIMYSLKNIHFWYIKIGI